MPVRSLVPKLLSSRTKRHVCSTPCGTSKLVSTVSLSVLTCTIIGPSTIPATAPSHFPLWIHLRNALGLAITAHCRPRLCAPTALHPARSPALPIGPQVTHRPLLIKEYKTPWMLMLPTPAFITLPRRLTWAKPSSKRPGGSGGATTTGSSFATFLLFHRSHSINCCYHYFPFHLHLDDLVFVLVRFTMLC